MILGHWLNIILLLLLGIEGAGAAGLTLLMGRKSRWGGLMLWDVG